MDLSILDVVKNEISAFDEYENPISPNTVIRKLKGLEIPEKYISPVGATIYLEIPKSELDKYMQIIEKLPGEGLIVQLC